MSFLGEFFSIFRESKSEKQSSAYQLVDDNSEVREIEAIKNLADKLLSYSKTLSRRAPKEFWIESRVIRIFLGIRRHTDKFGLKEEVLWISFDSDTEKYRMSIFSGEHGLEKGMARKEFSALEPTFVFIKERCETFFRDVGRT
tara:strand:- start:943 stop:1371 length:429 start_codon:yes stop_codon:yes gene_type:complete